MKLIVKGFAVNSKALGLDVKVDEYGLEYAPEELKTFQESILALVDKAVPLVTEVADAFNKQNEASIAESKARIEEALAKKPN